MIRGDIWAQYIYILYILLYILKEKAKLSKAIFQLRSEIHFKPVADIFETWKLLQWSEYLPGYFPVSTLIKLYVTYSMSEA